MPRPPQSIARRLLTLAAPIMGLNVLNVLALAVDTAMVGRVPDGETALTALSFATQVVFLLVVLMMGLSVGSIALVARAHGARDPDRVNTVLAQSTMLTAGLAFLVATIGNLVAPTILALLGAEPHVVDVGMEYLRPLLFCSLFYYLNILYGGVLRGVGNTRLAFFVAIISNLANFLFNYGLILGNWGLPALGVRGAAIGTVASQLLGLVIMVTVLRRGAVAGIRPTIRPVRIDGTLTRQIIRIGAPAAADMVILNAGFMAIVGMLGRVDQVAVAAHGIGLRIQALAFVPGLGVSQATGAMVGQALGARDADEARGVVRASLVLCTAVMSSLAVVIIAAAYHIVAVFDVAAGSELEGYAVTWMRLLGYGMPLFGLNIAFVGLLQGAGATRTSLGINFFSTLLVQMPLGWLLGFPLGLGATGIWLSFPLSYIVKSGLGALAYRRGRWARLGAEV